jgi:uncharacterized membrane protein YbaN (DUF454 family)
MNLYRRLLIHIPFAVIGIVLIGLATAGVVDSFWAGMGTALLLVSALRFVRLYRYQKNETYREQVDTEINDERNRFLRNKAWAWAGYLFVLIAAVCTIVFKVMEQEVLWQVTGLSMCLIVILYWISFFILRKKY